MLFTAETGPVLFAHRGAPTEWPENSLQALGRALDVGADVLEIDVHMTRDGHPVVSHDPDGTRCARVDRRIADCGLREVQSWDLWAGFAGEAAADRARIPARIPSLEEVLLRFPDVHLNIDVKQGRPDMVGPLLRLLTRFRAHKRVLLTSFSSLTTHRIRRRGYPGPTGLGRAEALYTLLSPRALVRAFPPAGARLQIPVAHGRMRLDTRAIVERVHRLGRKLDYWVINEPGEAERLLDLGADGIVTDVPAAIAPLFQRHPRCQRYRERHA